MSRNISWEVIITTIL